MPTPSNVVLRVQVNGGAHQTGPVDGGIVVETGDTVDFSAYNSAGARSHRIEIYEYPDGFSLPAGWTEDEDTGAYYYLGAVAPQITIAAPWGGYLARLLVDNGTRQNSEGQQVTAPDLIDDTIGLVVESTSGLKDTPFRSTNQFDQQRQWAGPLKENWRAIETQLVALGATGSDYKGSVRAATTEAVAHSGEQTIDGVALVAGDDVLDWHHATPALRGIWVVSAGAWTRRDDADTSARMTSGATVYVEEGTTNAKKRFVLVTPDPIVLGTTALTWEQSPDYGSDDIAWDGPGESTSVTEEVRRISATFDTGDFEVNVPDDAITTLYPLDFDALPGQAVPFGAAGSAAFGHIDLIINEAGADGSSAGSECGCHIRRYVRRRVGGNVEFVGAPVPISEHNFGHELTFTDGDPALLRITKASDYDSTLSVRVSGQIQTRTLADP